MIDEFLLNILRGINGWLGNYGWSMIIFSLIVRLLLSPFDFKSRVSMRKMSKVQPKMAELQKKYAKDQNKLNQKMSELYKKEKVSPLSGCLPMLLSYPILIIMWGAMRSFANEQMVRQVIEILQNPGSEPVMDGFLWIKNLWMPDSPFASMMVDFNSLRQIPADVWTRLMTADVIAALPAELQALTADSFAQANLADTVAQINTALQGTWAYQTYSGVMPGWAGANMLGLVPMELKQYWNGLFLLPVLSAVSQLVMTKLTPTQPTPAPDPKDEKAMASQSTGKFMQWFFPLFSLWICASYNAAFALYWVTTNIAMMVSTVAFNKYLDYKDKMEQKETIAGEGVIK